MAVPLAKERDGTTSLYTAANITAYDLSERSVFKCSMIQMSAFEFRLYQFDLK